jgi:hypothetical protein
MDLLTKPNQWSCLATSFAMALGITTEQFYQFAGHDGSEKIWPELPEPLCRRGFHVSEAALVCLLLRHSATPLELFPVIAATPLAPYHGTEQYQVNYPPKVTSEENWRLFTFYIDHGQGVIECRTRNGNWHAVAFERGVIYDPDGRHFGYSREACEARGLFTTRLWKVLKA